VQTLVVDSLATPQERLVPELAGEGAPVSTNTEIPRLAIHLKDQTWEVPLEGDSYSIGREEGNDIRIDHLSISRQHARLERKGVSFVLHDAGSTNGVWLEQNGTEQMVVRVDSHTLEDGDTLRLGRARLVFKAGFHLDDLTLAGIPLIKGKLVRRRPVLFVPGIMGSELWLGSERLWPSPRHLLNPEVAAFPGDPRIEARGLVKEVVIIPGFLKQEQYNRMGDFLEAGLGYERENDLLEFPYDWRQDIRLSAQRLAETLERWRVPRPVTIIAHSLGSLVSRYFVERLGGKDQVERLILLGGPHYGAPKMISTLLRGPGLLPFGLMNVRLRSLLASFPSGYQVLPTYASVEDQNGEQVNLLEDETWATEEQLPALRLARAFRRELPARSSVPTVSIFGYGLKTISKVVAHRNRDGRIEKMDFHEEAVGDGSVPAVSAVLRRSEIHPVRQDHGSLYVDNDVRMRLKLELTRPQA
jgi:pSer/pThr/pTyr-binding forkhead associated (FHA) protein